MQFKPIFISICCLSLIGCDQVRDRLTNGFNWDRKISSINNNELTPQNAEQKQAVVTKKVPQNTGKPLDSARIIPPKSEAPKTQVLSAQKPKKAIAAVPVDKTETPDNTVENKNVESAPLTRPVKQTRYKNVSGMSENDW